MKSIIVAFSNPLLTNWATSVLTRGGYSIEYSCKTGAEVARVADFCTSPVVLSGFQFPDMTAEDLLGALDGRLAMIVVMLPHQRDLLERRDLTSVPYPVSAMDLLQAIEEIENQAAKKAATGTVIPGKHKPTERPAEEKLLILKAKTQLMDENQMTESQAHRFLQKASMDRGLKLIDAARMVLERSLAV
ncbi:MAG TPA: ANTAR domain-containing protein [Treponemataceae bacterium]|nr:ANTAR domain-containing protein [Treponemataceae bacterium]HPS45301.1 ANTAR domain-containing protein [Treponemataceae bacterium]